MTCAIGWFLASFDVSENRSKTFKRIRRCVPFVESCSYRGGFCNCHSSEAVGHRVGRVLSLFSSRPNWDPLTPRRVCPPPFSTAGISCRRQFIHSGSTTKSEHACDLWVVTRRKRTLRGVKGLLQRPFQSVCSLFSRLNRVPHPLLRKRVWLPPGPKCREPHSLAGGGGGGTQFRQLDRHSGTLYTV